MKPRRTSLPSDAATGSVRAPAAPTPSVDGSPSPSAALRERLTQTRARMAEAQARKPPQIDIDWDPEELPTRRYDGETLFGSWRRGQRYQATPQTRTRLGSGEVPIAQDPETSNERSAELPDTRPRGRVRSAEVPLGTHAKPPHARASDPAPAADRLPGPRARSGEMPVAPSVDEPRSCARFTDEPVRPRARSGEMPVAPSVDEPRSRARFTDEPVRHRARSGEMPVAPNVDEPRSRPRSSETRVDHIDEPVRHRACSSDLLVAPADTRPRERPHSAEQADTHARFVGVPVAPATAARENAMQEARHAFAPPTGAQAQRGGRSHPADTLPRTHVRPGEPGFPETHPQLGGAYYEAREPRAATLHDWPEALDASDFVTGGGAADEHTIPPRFAREPVRPRARARSGEVPIGTSFGEPTSVAPHASHALDPSTFPGWRPRKRARDALSTPTPLSVEPEPADHIAPIADTPTRAPLATLFLREVSAVAEHLQDLYARMDHSERALRNRVAICSGGLLLIAATSALFPHDERQPQPTAASAPPIPLPTASVSVSSDPPGAQIFLDGQASGKVTPASIDELTAGKHRIGLQLAGYSEATEALRLPEDALLSIKLAPLSAPRAAPQAVENRPQSRAEARAQARALARERRAAARAARVMSRYRTRMGLPADPDAD